MLENLRQQAQTPAGRFFLVFIFGLLGVSFFIAFGPSGRVFEPMKSDFAARIDGDQISRTEFERYYYRQVRQFGSLDPAMLDRILPRSRVLDEMIKDRLVAAKALQEGIDVSDAELRKAILDDPSFQDEDGKFSAERYHLVVQRSLGMSVDLYEDELRRELRARKLGALLRETAKVPEAALRRKFDEENDRVDLRFVRFSPAFYTSQVKVTDAEAAALLKDHADEVRAAYDKQQNVYHAPKQVEARHILIKVPAGNAAPNSSADDTAKERLTKIKEDVEKGTAKFADLAKSQSQAGDAASGGELGLVRPGSHLFDPAIEGAALSLQEGKVSEPVRSRQGWEIVQAEKIIPAQDHPFEEVKTAVARDLLVHQRAVQKAEAQAKKAQAELADGKDLEDLFPAAPALEKGERPKPSDHPVSDTTGPFARSPMGFLPKIGQGAELQKEAFDADGPKALAGPARVGETFVVAAVAERQKADPAQFEKQKDELRENAQRELEVELMQALRAKLRSEAGASVQVNNAVMGPALPEEG